MPTKISKAETRQREKFTASVMGRTIMGVTIADGELALVMDDDTILMVWEDDGEIRTWAGYPCDD